jgi:hypothetical protein
MNTDDSEELILSLKIAEVLPEKIVTTHQTARCLNPGGHRLKLNFVYEGK